MRVVVADSHSIYRLGLSRILEQHSQIRVVAEAETYSETLAAAMQNPAEVLLFEAQLTGELAQAVSAILAKAPGLRIISESFADRTGQQSSCNLAPRLQPSAAIHKINKASSAGRSGPRCFSKERWPSGLRRTLGKRV